MHGSNDLELSCTDMVHSKCDWLIVWFAGNLKCCIKYRDYLTSMSCEDDYE
jgi:hypothetical protein